jgi:hypothetical protein
MKGYYQTLSSESPISSKTNIFSPFLDNPAELCYYISVFCKTNVLWGVRIYRGYRRLTSDRRKQNCATVLAGTVSEETTIERKNNKTGESRRLSTLAFSYDLGYAEINW